MSAHSKRRKERRRAQQQRAQQPGRIVVPGAAVSQRIACVQPVHVPVVGWRVSAWSQRAGEPAEAVLLHLKAGGPLILPEILMPMTSAAAADALIDQLIRHRCHVWPAGIVPSDESTRSDESVSPAE